MRSNRLKMSTDLLVSIVLSIGIIAMSLIYIFWGNFSIQSNIFHGERGFIDLNQWDRYKDTNIYLDGEWAFYPNVLLMPEDNFEEYEHIKKYVEVPGSWESYLNEDAKVDGAGTYRIKMQLPQDDIYGIKTRTIRSSSRIFAEGSEIISTGNPSTDPWDYVPEEMPKIGFAESENQELEFIIHVSSYDYPTGGITSPIEFGRYESILNQDRIARGIDAMAISIAFVLGLYFFVTYFQRGRGKDLLYFSLTSIFICIYLSTASEQLLHALIPYDQNTRMQIQLFAVMLAMICLLKFMYHSFKGYSNKKVIDIIITMIALSSTLAFFTVDGTGFITIEFSQYFVLATTLLAFIKVFYILIKSIVKKADSLGYILIFASAMFTCWIAAMLRVLFEFDLGNIMIVLVFIMLISIALLMGDRLQLDYRKANTLSKKLIRDDRLKDEFLAKASHELSTPLHVILNLSQSLIEGNKGSLNAKQQESLFFIGREGKRLSQLVADLLNATGIKDGETQLRIKSMDIHRIVGNILREMEMLIPEDKNLQLVNNIPADFPMIHSDPDKFTQIIYNLVNNSIKYTNAGKIEISAIVEDEKVIFEVKDTGIGIRKEDEEEIFKVFYRMDEDSKNTGMGLGLPITKQLVEVLGGAISVQSIYGEGSSFIFTLPKDESEIASEEINDMKIVEPEEPIVEPWHSSLDQPVILIVDDIRANQKVLMDVLEFRGYDLLMAKDGKEALEVLENNKVDLIVLDFMLPDMDGDQVCSIIREKYSITELPIIILTASGRTADFKKSFHCGANDFIKKPADAQEMVTRINALLSMKKSVTEGVNRELQYFYSQISPHFLHNTLNTIIGLSYKDSEKARDALLNLSIYFRGKLDLYKDATVIPLLYELELVEAYLAIEQMRYGDRLKFEVNLETDDFNATIPPLTIQPLVENAVRHGVIRKESGGHIEVNVQRHMEDIIVTIKDDGVGMSEEKLEEVLGGRSNSIAFKNVMEKIKRIKGATLELESKELKGTTIKITIPEGGYNESDISG